MPISSSITATPNASRYLQQLCRHWAHKFSVSFDAATGQIEFGEGRFLTLKANDAELSLRLIAPDEASRQKMEQVVAEHLLRFAFKEELSFSWKVVD